MDDIAALDRLVRATTGVGVVAAERAAFGSMHRTDTVRCADGRELVVQRYAARWMAERRITTAELVAPALATSAVAVPVPLAADLDADPPFAVFPRLPGEPLERLVGAGLPAVQAAVLVGGLLPIVQSVPIAGMALPDTWADPSRLGEAARSNLGAVRSRLPARAATNAERFLAGLPSLLAGRPAGLAHGDLVASNVLVEGNRVTALLDWEFSRLADPLFDAAWFAWTAATRPPWSDAASVAWSAFVAAAAIDPTGPDLRDRIQLLIVLRLLEIAAHAATTGDASRGGEWASALVDAVTTDWLPAGA